MPYRRIPFGVGETYHVFNRSVAGQPIFSSYHENQRALELIEFYSAVVQPFRFSHLKRLAIEQRTKILEEIRRKEKLATILGFCLMPNHFHFLLQERKENGIRRFLTNFQNSFAKYFNTKTKRSGALFQAMFKAVRIESNEQFLHVLRYIHLNPYTSYLISTSKDLAQYPWSSYPTYIGKIVHTFVDPKPILDSFSSKNSFKEFTLNQSDYQRELKHIKHLLFEE